MSETRLSQCLTEQGGVEANTGSMKKYCRKNKGDEIIVQTSKKYPLKRILKDLEENFRKLAFPKEHRNI